MRAVLAIATACIVAAGVLVAQSSRNGSRSVDTLALAAKDGAASGRFSLVNLDVGAARDVNIPGMAMWGDSFYPIVHTGSRLVYLEGQKNPPSLSAPPPRVLSYSDRFGGEPVSLGRADAIVPSARPGFVWLVRRVRNYRFDVNVSEVDASAPASARTWHLNGEPLIGVEGGLLVDVLTKDSEQFVVWKPGAASRRVISSRRLSVRGLDGRVAPIPGALLFGGLAGESAVVGTGCDQYQFCEELKVVDIGTGAMRTVPRPANVDRWAVGQDVPRHALSPSGKYIVMPVKGSSVYPRIVVDLNGRIVHRFDGVAASALWTDDGEWVIVQRLESLVAFRPADGTIRTFRLHYNGPVPITLPASLWHVERAPNASFAYRDEGLCPPQDDLRGLGVDVPVVPDEAIPVLTYSCAIVGTFGREPMDVVVAGVHVVGGQRPVVAAPVSSGVDDDTGRVIDALNGRDGIEDVLTGYDPDVLHRLGALSRFFRGV